MTSDFLSDCRPTKKCKVIVYLPCVASMRKLPRLQALGGAPGEGDLLPLGHDVTVVLLRQSPHQAEVADLDFVDRGQEDVPAGKVPVDEALAFQVGHALGDLDGKVPDHVDWDVSTLEKWRRKK